MTDDLAERIERLEAKYEKSIEPAEPAAVVERAPQTPYEQELARASSIAKTLGDMSAGAWLSVPGPADEVVT